MVGSQVFRHAGSVWQIKSRTRKLLLCRGLLFGILRYVDRVHTKLAFQIASALREIKRSCCDPIPAVLRWLDGYGMLISTRQLHCHMTVRPTSSGCTMSAEDHYLHVSYQKSNVHMQRAHGPISRCGRQAWAKNALFVTLVARAK